MHVLIAPDSFKGSLTAAQAADAIAAGVRDAAPEATIDRCPIADGGEGTLEAMMSAAGDDGRWMLDRVTGPLGEPVDARWGLIDGGATAVIEMAEAAGLTLVPIDRRDPMRTTTFGVGQLITAALDADAGRIVIAIGGSATCDGGAGMAQALGVRFMRGGAAIDEPMCGGLLEGLTAVDTSGIDRRLRGVRIEAACDVTNPLYGPDGAAAVYGPQKGATPAQVATLDRGLRRLASCVAGVDADVPGMGAAGGMGFGLVAFCGATLRRGVSLVLDAVCFDERVRDADLVITGEGRLDGQSASGKACVGVAEAARRRGAATIAVVGSLGPGHERSIEHGIDAVYAICDGGIEPERAMAQAADHLRRRAAEALTEWRERR